MAVNTAQLMVAVGDGYCCLKVSGRASNANAPALEAVFVDTWRRGTRRFVLELSECAGMDSTFIGKLLGISRRLSEDAAHPGTVELLNATDPVLHALDNLGVTSFFKLVQSDPAQTREFEQVQQRALSKTEMTLLCLQAHRNLMEVNPANIPKFKDVARFLEEDLKRGSS